MPLHACVCVCVSVCLCVCVLVVPLICTLLPKCPTLLAHTHTEIFHTKPQRSQTSRYEKAVTFVPKKAATVVSMLFGAYPLDMSQYGRLFHSTR
jgi:hypothetical protein